MGLRSTLLWLGLSTALSAGIWLTLREPIGIAIRAVTVTALRLTGQRPVYSSQILDRQRNDGSENNQVAVRVGSASRDGKQHTRYYGMSLMRWHVNLIVLPALALSIGQATACRRVIIVLTGIPLLLVLDGSLAFLFLSLAASRIRGEELGSLIFHESLEHGLAVYVTKILPVLVWALLFLATRPTARGKPRL